MLCNSEATKKLFKAIEFKNVSDEDITPEKAWDHFQQALKEGANVNAFQEEGMTPLMFIPLAFSSSTSKEEQSKLKSMAKLLVQHKNIDINIKSNQPVTEEISKEHDGYPVYTFLGKEVVDMGEKGCVYLKDGQPIGEGFVPSEVYSRVKYNIDTGKKKENTALHIACYFWDVDMVKILLTHPNIKTNIKNYENKSPKDCITGYVKEVIESEFIKVEAAARKRKYTNYACAFLLSGVLAAGICFAVYPLAAGICFTVCPLAVAALLFFAIGLYYGANLVLNDVNFSQVGCERAK